MAAAVREIVFERREYLGTATALLAEINNRVPLEICREKTWPKDAGRLSNRLRRLAPALRRLGIEIDTNGHIGRGAEKKRAIRLYRAEVGTINAFGGDDGKRATVPGNIKVNQGAKPSVGAGDGGDDEISPLSGSCPWETTI